MSWGDLIATRPTYFNVTAPSTVYPGDDLAVVMRMFDAYDQNVMDASDGYGQFSVDPAGVPANSFRTGGVSAYGNYVSGNVNISGSTFAGIPGRQYRIIAGAHEALGPVVVLCLSALGAAVLSHARGDRSTTETYCCPPALLLFFILGEAASRIPSLVCRDGLLQQESPAQTHHFACTPKQRETPCPAPFFSPATMVFTELTNAAPARPPAQRWLSARPPSRK